MGPTLDDLIERGQQLKGNGRWEFHERQSFYEWHDTCCEYLESLYDTVESSIHIKVRERLPDTVIGEADEIVNVDLTPKDLRRRLHEGKIYPKERVDTALTNFFRTENLEKLRELTLRELASQIDLKMRVRSDDNISATPDQVMVCLSSRGPNSEMLLRYGSRLAGRLNRSWYAVLCKLLAKIP